MNAANRGKIHFSKETGPSSAAFRSYKPREELNMPLTSAAAATILALQLGTPAAIQSQAPAVSDAPIVQVGYCGNGYDIDVYGRCFPNGVIPPEYQAARQYGRHSRYDAYDGPVPCGNGADVDSRDGRCYPNGTVPRRYQEGLQRGRGYYRY